MTETVGDLHPRGVPDTAALGVVLVQLGLEEILVHVDDQPWNIADHEHDHNGAQSSCCLGQVAGLCVGGSLSLEGNVDEDAGDEEEHSG